MIVVTHTAGNRPELLKLCRSSVEEALTPQDSHLIIPCTSQLGKARFKVGELPGWVGFVDDDDTILPFTLERVNAAISRFPDVGAIFTNENEHGAVRVAPRTWFDICLSPLGAHHFCAFNTKFIPPDLGEFIGDDPLSDPASDWLIKASCAIIGGARHLPFVGYNWNTHPGSYSRTIRCNRYRDFNEYLKKLCAKHGRRMKDFIPHG